MPKTRTMAIDLSTRNLGWACASVGSNRPSFGLVKLPGMKDLGVLYASVRNGLTGLFEEHRPRRLVFCLAMFSDIQTTARALNGVQAVAELTAYDHEVEAFEAIESRARKAVLGRGHFGGKDPVTGSLVPGLGRKQAKEAVAQWSTRMGYETDSDDVRDALVLLEYALRQMGRPVNGRGSTRDQRSDWERAIFTRS
jgi:Holliday junction resolvasome RuvABC endonuclease subunit